VFCSVFWSSFTGDFTSESFLQCAHRSTFFQEINKALKKLQAVKAFEIKFIYFFNYLCGLDSFLSRIYTCIGQYCVVLTLHSAEGEVQRGKMFVRFPKRKRWYLDGPLSILGCSKHFCKPCYRTVLLRLQAAIQTAHENQAGERCCCFYDPTCLAVSFSALMMTLLACFCS